MWSPERSSWLSWCSRPVPLSHRRWTSQLDLFRLAPVPPAWRWVGSKRELAALIADRLPADIADYREPFAGSGAVALALLSRARPPRRVLLADANAEAIACWRMVRDQPDRLADALEALVARDSAAEFLAIRSQRTDGMATLDRAARFLYLVGAARCGMWRENKRGRFNASYQVERRWFAKRAELLAVSRLVQRCEFQAGDFSEAMAGAGPGTVIYCDPPYTPSSPTARFDDYCAGSFGRAGQRRLAAACRSAADAGALVLASNNDLPAVRELYRGASFETIEHEHRTKNRQAVRELLIRLQNRMSS
jgi:DNA adenine methylase